MDGQRVRQLPIGSLSAILFDQSVRDYREAITAIDIPTLICWGRHEIQRDGRGLRLAGPDPRRIAQGRSRQRACVALGGIRR